VDGLVGYIKGCIGYFQDLNVIKLFEEIDGHIDGNKSHHSFSKLSHNIKHSKTHRLRQETSNSDFHWTGIEPHFTNHSRLDTGLQSTRLLLNATIKLYIYVHTFIKLNRVIVSYKRFGWDGSFSWKHLYLSMAWSRMYGTLRSEC
jgi:hypothetical protein